MRLGSVQGRWGEGHEGVEYVVQRGGVHNDPFLDFFVGNGPEGGVQGKEQGEVTSVVLEWLAVGL